MRRDSLSRHQQAVPAQRAAAMRAAPTFSELVLWQALKGSQLGVAFRRQVVVGGFIADFLAPRVKLIVEVDGGYHGEAAAVRGDARRDRALGRFGYRVLHLSSEVVVHNLPAAVAAVRVALAAG